MIHVYFAAGAQMWPRYQAPLAQALAAAGVEAVVSEVAPADPTAVDYLIVANGGMVSDFAPFTGARAVLNLWAGVEKLVGNATLTQPLCRMVDPAMTESMVEYVTGHVLRHHLGIDRHILNDRAEWLPEGPGPARSRSVTVLGLGELGSACATMLAALNFRVTGWSRTPKSLPGIRCLSGEAGLSQALAEAEILVLLMPYTAETENLLNAGRIALMPAGAVVINPGRGQLIDDGALLAALDSGHLANATLDVFRVEPLPAEHPFWAHPKVTVTPHIAAETYPETAAVVVAENIRRAEAGEPLMYLVDRGRGY
ncbi:glyoxylate/hydroxypyruvate reductase A [Frigidibacter albus]|uniref:Glyoxylate/hydroxypyruvate reductase A n=1 Tax=Frigidibacter albus TaxID=1465486 RepID=A0A6L8VEE9_9RHOB|nr:glyoxylate/hydroxypyruvate reductase A [Frigidibacter albus]MZQ88613.1 glyoxylate/hydroxypyruvate reductase A [Frigidibacter albus]NBE30578.1 glyoxylate/hydroxypyruvate reductase A [Frigidibacter albus]GGH49452.1 glyoxylate/hydroxypyruvate reductase A [Frigidibacter albus]